MTFARYVLVQLVAYLIDMGGFLLILKLGWAGWLVANIVGKGFAGVFAFFAHRNFTFRGAQEGSGKAQATKYFVLLGLNLPLSTAVLALVLKVLPQPVPAKLVADAVCILVTYWLSKKVVFSRSQKNTRTSAPAIAPSQGSEP